MQIESTNTNSIRFGAIRSSVYMNNTERQIEIFEKIDNEAHKICPKDRKKRSYLKLMEDNGYNIYFNQGAREDGVDVYVSSTRTESGMPSFRIDTLVGKYENPEEFDIGQLWNVYKSQRDAEVTNGCVKSVVLGAILTFISIWAGYMGYKAAKNMHFLNSLGNNPKIELIQGK